MKLALVGSVPVPHVYGGMDRLFEGLAAALRKRHPTDLITVPVDELSAEAILKGYHDFYHLDLSAYDAVISCKGPAYMVRHPVHVGYLSHRLRVFYDRYERRDAQHARVRRLIHWLDNWALAPERVPCLYTIGETVSRRLLRWGGIESTPLHLPTTLEPLAPEPGEFFFAAGRLHEWKRFDLIIRAMRAAETDRTLVIAGRGPAEGALRELAGDDPRIRFVGHLTEQQLREYYAKSLAVIFPPIGEDLGLVTFEAFGSSKPVITTDDSGEPAEVVEHERTGLILPPTPEAMAAALDRLAAQPDRAEAMGRAGREWVAQVTWDRVADTLLDAVAQTRRMGRRSSTVVANGSIESTSDAPIRLLVTDNQIIDPPVGGGRVRIWELYRHMPDDFTTTYIGTHDHPGPVFRDRWLAPNFREIILPLTIVHFKLHEIWRRLTRGDATVDVTMPLLGRCSPRYRRTVAEHLPEADLLIGAHPWMFPQLIGLEGPPKVYDSQNCEAVVKGQLLRRTWAGRYLARRVARTERLAATASRVTLVCSPTDAEEFSRRYGLPAERIVPAFNGVDCERIQPGPDAEKPARRRALDLPESGSLALFLASNYEPNLEGLEFLIDTVAPAFPEMTLAVVGGVGVMWRERHPDDPLPPNVRLLGFVSEEDLGAALDAADVALNPMSRGSGTNIKMLDYMAAGLPIVTTEVGARGLDGCDGEHWIQTDLEGFGATLGALLNDSDRRRRLGTQARERAERQYDWRIIAGRVAEVLRELVREARAARRDAS